MFPPLNRAEAAMAGFVEGVNRQQITLFPARFDEYVGEDNPVRAVDIGSPGADDGLHI